MALICADGGSRAASMSMARPIAGGLVDQQIGGMGASWWQNWGCVSALSLAYLLLSDDVLKSVNAHVSRAKVAIYELACERHVHWRAGTRS
jgi:hypothetical protein